MNLSTRIVSVGDAFGQFEEWLHTTRTLGERTKIEYRDDIARLVTFLGDVCHVTAIAAVERGHLVRYMGALTTAGQAANTRRRVVAAVRLFFRVLAQEGVLPRSPAQLLLPPPREDRPPRILTKDEYERLRAGAEDARAAALIRGGYTYTDPAPAPPTRPAVPTLPGGGPPPPPVGLPRPSVPPLPGAATPNPAPMRR